MARMSAGLFAAAFCAGAAHAATLQPDTLVCDPIVPTAQLLENSRTATQQPASEVLRRARVALDALEREELDLDSAVMAKREVAIFKATVLLNRCGSSGVEAVPVTVVERRPEVVKISMTYRGAPVTVYAERSAVLD
jgi:hypothetical protein